MAFGQTDGRHAISILRYALVHRAVKTRILVYGVCLVNLNEAIKLRDLEKPLLDARFLAITLIQAAL